MNEILTLNPLINLNITKRHFMCLLMCYSRKYTILSIKCSGQKLESESDQTFRSNSLQDIQGTEEHVTGNNEVLFSKV